MWHFHLIMTTLKIQQDCKTVKANNGTSALRDADKTTDSEKTLPKDQQAAKLTNS